MIFRIFHFHRIQCYLERFLRRNILFNCVSDANAIRFHKVWFQMIFYYSVTRMYWSTRTPYQRSMYTCRVVKVDTSTSHGSPARVIADTTIVHDPDIEGYTAPELLCTRYPSVFDPRKFGECSNSTPSLIGHIVRCIPRCIKR